MSFLSGLFGGSNGATTQTQSQGYSALPSQLQQGFNGLGTQVAQLTNPANPGVTNMFTPIAQTAGETQAYNSINQGFAPTQQSLSSDMSMLQNPYNQSVIGGINNAANSDYSILKQNQDQTGTYGSNRTTLGANDIEDQRQNMIGSLLQGQYNTALGTVFNNIIPQQQQDAYNQLNAGSAQRQLALQTSEAPITALQAGTGMISPFTAGGTSSSYNPGTSNGIIPGLADAGKSVAGLGLAFSDINLKENIKYIGKKNGHNIYEFSYKGDHDRFIGVMAQEILETNPEAVTSNIMRLMVDYDKLGVEFRRVA